MCRYVCVCDFLRFWCILTSCYLSSGFDEGKLQEHPWPESETSLAVLLSSSLGLRGKITCFTTLLPKFHVDPEPHGGRA